MSESPRAGNAKIEGDSWTGAVPRTRPQLRRDMTVRQVAADDPASCEVFRLLGEPDRQSLKFGHLEPLDHFARRHGIPLDALRAELPKSPGSRSAVRLPPPDGSTGRSWLSPWL